METEWQHYLRQCIDTIVSIAEGRPFQVFEQVVSLTFFFKRNSNAWYVVQDRITQVLSY